MEKIGNQLISVGLSLAIGLVTIGAMSGSLSSCAAPPKKGESRTVGASENVSIPKCVSISGTNEDSQMINRNKVKACSMIEMADMCISEARRQLSILQLESNQLIVDLSTQASDLRRQLCTLQSKLETTSSSSDVGALLPAIDHLESDAYNLYAVCSAI